MSYGHQFVDTEDKAGVVQILDNRFLTTGPMVDTFELELCRLTGAKFTIACANGTTALHLACLAIDIKHGDLGLATANSFLASANCIEHCDGKVDFIDIDSGTLCLSPDRLENYCQKSTTPKVVIPVDFAGMPANLPAIWALSRQYGFKVIEDAAHAIGSTYDVNGQTFACGSCAHSDLAVFSFHPVKNITTGEGGAVMTNDAELADKLRLLRNHGMDRSWALQEIHGGWYYEMNQMGYNYRITDIQCALGVSQLKKLPRFKERRQAIVARYNRAFNGHAGLILPPKGLETDACPHLYPIRIKKGAELRRNVYDKLKQDGIFCQVHYIPIYWQPYYADKYGYQRGKCPEAEKYYSQCLSLPLFPSMTDDDVDRVVKRFLTAVNE